MAPAVVGEIIVVALVATVGVVVVASAVGIRVEDLVLLADSVAKGVARVAAQTVAEVCVEGLAEVTYWQAKTIAEEGPIGAAYADIVSSL